MSESTLFEDDPSAGQRTFTVATLAAEIGRSLQREFGTDVWVEGEMRNLKRSANGHVYFDLVDECPPGAQPAATLSVVLFRSTRDVVNKYLRAGGGQRMDDGMQVRIRGTIDFYPPQGRLQIRMTGIDPTYTLGRLIADRERILTGLRDDDLIDANARLPIPLLPHRIALVTSAGSAAEKDFVSELERSRVGWRVTIIDTRVQGFAAVENICAALRRATRHGQMIALVRGGGARTDLAAFDSDAVARTIATSTVPVVTGIGHEIDRSVADEVAAISTKTPTAAASVIIAMVDDVQQNVVTQTHRLAKVTAMRLSVADQRLTQHAQRADVAVGSSARLAENRIDACQRRMTLAASTRSVAAHSAVAMKAERLVRSAPRALGGADTRLRQLEEAITRVDPAQLLLRGWSIARTQSGAVIRSVESLDTGGTIHTTVSDGVIASTVTDTTHEETPST